MQQIKKWGLILLLSLATAAIFVAFFYEHGKFFLTAGIFLTMAGIIQLEITGFFDVVIKEYCDDKKYPFGPPSFITREIIDNPDTPVRSYLKNMLFFDRHSGVWLLIMGCILQIIGTWL